MERIKQLIQLFKEAEEKGIQPFNHEEMKALAEELQIEFPEDVWDFADLYVLGKKILSVDPVKLETFEITIPLLKRKRDKILTVVASVTEDGSGVKLKVLTAGKGEVAIRKMIKANIKKNETIEIERR